MINSKELKEDKNVKQKEEDVDSSVTMEELFDGFNAGKKRKTTSFQVIAVPRS